jgi:hypothetical protein
MGGRYPALPKHSAMAPKCSPCTGVRGWVGDSTGHGTGFYHQGTEALMITPDRKSLPNSKTKRFERGQRIEYYKDEEEGWIYAEIERVNASGTYDLFDLDGDVYDDVPADRIRLRQEGHPTARAPAPADQDDEDQENDNPTPRKPKAGSRREYAKAKKRGSAIGQRLAMHKRFGKNSSQYCRPLQQTIWSRLWDEMRGGVSVMAMTQLMRECQCTRKAIVDAIYGKGRDPADSMVEMGLITVLKRGCYKGKDPVTGRIVGEPSEYGLSADIKQSWLETYGEQRRNRRNRAPSIPREPRGPSIPRNTIPLPKGRTNAASRPYGDGATRR